MHSARLSLLTCGLFLATFASGQAQTPPNPASNPPAPSNPATLPVSPQSSVAPITPPVPNTSGKVPREGKELPLPGSPAENSDTLAYSNDPTVDVNRSVILDNADTFEQTEPGKFTARGHVRVRYQGYKLSGDQVDVDTDQGTARFTGNVHLLAPNGQTADAGPNSVLQINLQRGTYQIAGARSVITPEQSQVGLILPIFVYGGTIRGRPGFIDARNGQFTTCDFLEPHYSFGAREMYIIPGKRLVGRNVSLYRKGHRIFSIPYLVVPLTDRLARQTLFPQVGETPDEGYFIKFAIGYALTDALPGILRVEEFQKKGTGLGFDQSYGSSSQPKRGSGLFTIYSLYDQSRQVEDLNGSLNHTQQFGTVLATLTSQFQQNSYFSGLDKSQSQNTTLSLTRNVGNLNSSFRTTLTQNDYGSGLSQNLTSSFDQTFSPTSNQQLHTRFDFSEVNSPGFAGFSGQDTQQLDSNLDYTNHGKLFDYEVLATKYNELHNSGSSSQFFGGLQRLPEFRIATDALRLKVLRQFLPKTTTMNLSLGAFDEPASMTNSQRARFDLDLGTTTQKINNRSDFQYGGSFEQGFYGDNTAQYVLNQRSGYRLRIGSKSTFGVTYTYLKPYGYTPFQFDYAGNTNLIGMNLAVQESKAFQLTVGTGYDLNREHSQYGYRATPFQSVATQVVYTPVKFLRFRTTASYDLNNSRLQDLTNALTIQGSDKLAFDFSGRYDPVLKRYTTLNGDINLPFFRDRSEDAGYRLRAIGGYNGITSKFDYKGLELTRSWHDYELSLTYQDTPEGLLPGSSFTLNFRLKAFPAYEPFATGQYGQALDTGIGQTL
jgi:lipopolysaccharide assembly outer membrane protein LptD (OstA)